MTGRNPQPGNWVKITARVLELHPNDVDLGVELFSKTDQYPAFVRRDLCEPTEKPIPAEPPIESVALVSSPAVIPNDRMHSVSHQRLGDGLWYAPARDGQASGWTWEALNLLGEVEVIHHA